MSSHPPAELCNGERLRSATPQRLYDAFNEFIFSPDSKLLGKLVARALLADRVREVPGDIVECGVFKGSGVLSWLKLKRLLYPGALKKVVGFDFFDTEALLGALGGADRERMRELFAERGYAHESGAECLLREQLTQAGFGPGDFELVRGDLSQTAPAFAASRPGFRISLLYLDVDLERPTYDALRAFWPRVARGGLVVLDEYGVDQWSEASGADAFFDPLGIPLRSLPFACPTAYAVKP